MSATGAPWLPRSIPDRSRLIALPSGDRIFVVDVGPGESPRGEPPLLLVHGLLTTHYAYERLVPRLAGARRVIAVDLPGAGDSDHPAPDGADRYSPQDLAAQLTALLDILDVAVVDYLGLDYGGTVGFVMAARGATRIRRLILCAPLLLHPSVPFEGALAISANLGAEVFRKALRRTDLQRALAQGMSTPELLSDAEVHVYWDRIGRRGGREAAYAMLAQLSTIVGLREHFASLRVPTLLVWGDRDRIVPLEQGKRLVELLPGRPPLLVIDGCGHNPARERPELLARAVEEHCG